MGTQQHDYSTVSTRSMDELVAHAGFLRALARGMLADEHLAEDVVQQAFLRALARPPAERGLLRAWLARVVRNLVLNARIGAERRARRERAVARDVVLDVVLDVADAAHERAGLELALQREVAAELSELDEPYRTVVHLRYFRGLSPASIAAELGVPPKTVETRLTRAHARLRQRLQRAWSEQDGRARALYLPSLPGAAQILGGLLMTKQIVLIGVGGALLVGFALTWHALEVRSGRAEAPAMAAAPVEPTPANVAPNETVASARESALVVPAPAVLAPEPAAPPEADAELHQALARLPSLLDRSLEGRLDPGAILDAALLVAAHELGAPQLEPDSAGRLVMPVEGMPAGVEATLCVSKPNRANQKVLTLELAFERNAPFAFENMERADPGVQLTTWTNEAEDLLHFSIHTDVNVARRVAVPTASAADDLGIGALYAARRSCAPEARRAAHEKEGNLQPDGGRSYKSGTGRSRGSSRATMARAGGMRREPAHARDNAKKAKKPRVADSEPRAQAGERGRFQLCPRPESERAPRRVFGAA
jgi:RNA polymerase sigma-70 factor (ECF subfamily)